MRTTIRWALTTTLAMMLFASAAGAQGRGRIATRGVPPGQLPPAGMCRIWIDGVPPGQQAAPTDCATARANVPANGRVIYGPSRPGNANGRGRGKGRGHDEAEHGKDRRHDEDEDDDRNDDDRRDDDRHHGDARHEDEHHDDARRGCVRDATGRCTDCVDANSDGRCDTRSIPRGYPTTLPEMADAVLTGQGKVTPEVARWLRGQQLTARTTTTADGKIDRISWLDSEGRVVQVWVDKNHDGRADFVELYRNGRVVRRIKP